MEAPDIRLWFATAEADRNAAYRVRVSVFVEEQKVPIEVEMDSLDEAALHLVASVNGEIVGTSRLVPLDDGTGLVGRVAVLPEWRRRGIAARMLETLEAKARELRLRGLVLHSQTYVSELYAKQGFAVTSGTYMEAGIEHVSMSKGL